MYGKPGAFQTRRDLTRAIISILLCVAAEVAVASLVIWAIIQFVKAVSL